MWRGREQHKCTISRRGDTWRGTHPAGEDHCPQQMWVATQGEREMTLYSSPRAAEHKGGGGEGGRENSPPTERGGGGRHTTTPTERKRGRTDHKKQRVAEKAGQRG